MKSKPSVWLLIIAVLLGIILTTVIWRIHPSDLEWGAIMMAGISLAFGLIIFRSLSKPGSAANWFGLDYSAMILIAVNVAIILTIILLLIDPSGELLRTTAACSLLVLAGIIGLVVVSGLFLLVRMIWSSGLSMGADVSDPTLFTEMQWLLGDVLRPMDFTLSRQDHQSLKFATFTRDAYSVCLSWDVLDRICGIEVYDRSEISINTKTQKPDFVIKCRKVRNAEKFKKESAAMLNEWLVKKGLK